MKSIIVGTAGHIDHGKTALVRALTGIDADRLPEEKRRGITIDLGFADLDLGGVRIGFIDVPGHERFVKNMLAGAHGIDAVALVVAADEGVMPQTREHFEICRLLGVKRGLVIITKKDLVDAELLDLVRVETEELVQRSFLEKAPIMAVSSRTREGIDALKETLRELAQEIPERSQELAPRLPIDRSFSMRGFGTVITGTLIAGEIGEGDELEILPEEKRVRVRGIQVHGATVSRAVAGQRTAINLGGIETAEIERGMVLSHAGRLRATLAADVSVQILSDAPRPLRSRQRLRVHVGAAEVLARVQILNEAREIKPGTNGQAQLRFETPVVCTLDDRFILRSYSPARTIGGGQILDPFASRHRARDLPKVQSRLLELSQGNRAAQLTAFVVAAQLHGLALSDLRFRTGWRDELIEEARTAALSRNEIVDAEGVLMSVGALQELKEIVINDISAHHQTEPLSRGLSKQTLRERHFGKTPFEIFRRVLGDLEKERGLLQDKEVVRLREHTRELSDSDAQLREALEKVYREALFEAPTIAEALEQAGVMASAQTHGRKVLQILVESGVLVRVHREMFFHQSALTELTRRVREYAGRNSERTIDVPAFKQLAGISRKYAIPLLEYLDQNRITRREGERRVVL